MYRKILVPVEPDHEGKGQAALAAAKALLEPGGSVILMHVMEPVPGYVASQLPAGTIETNRENAMNALRAMADDSGMDLEIKMLTGHPSTTINSYAEDNGVDCIIIASHKPGLEDYFLGSTAARVVRHAPCSVHVMR